MDILKSRERKIRRVKQKCKFNKIYNDQNM